MMFLYIFTSKFSYYINTLSQRIRLTLDASKLLVVFLTAIRSSSNGRESWSSLSTKKKKTTTAMFLDQSGSSYHTISCSPIPLIRSLHLIQVGRGGCGDGLGAAVAVAAICRTEATNMEHPGPVWWAGSGATPRHTPAVAGVAPKSAAAGVAGYGVVGSTPNRPSVCGIVSKA
jgi:hypothetical protein